MLGLNFNRSFWPCFFSYRSQLHWVSDKWKFNKMFANIQHWIFSHTHLPSSCSSLWRPKHVENSRRDEDLSLVPAVLSHSFMLASLWVLYNLTTVKQSENNPLLFWFTDLLLLMLLLLFIHCERQIASILSPSLTRDLSGPHQWCSTHNTHP